MMNYLKGLLALAAVLAVMLPGTASAVGTGAGTVIANTATATYGVGTLTGLTQASNTVNVTVQQVTDVVVAPIFSPTVNPGDTGVAAIFTVSNTGNGPDTFALTPNSTIPVGDNFDPLLSLTTVGVDLYSDGFVPGVGGDSYANVVTLGADAYATILVFNNIPAGVADAYTGLTQVSATSNTASGAPGTLAAGAGVGGVNAIVGGNSGTGSAQATYTVSSVVVSVVKTSAITADPYSVGAPFQSIPGATVQYTLTVSVTGSGTANGVVITDPIPANTTPVAASLVIPATATGDIGTTTPGVVTVNLGPIVGGAAAQIITFDVTIN